MLFRSMFVRLGGTSSNVILSYLAPSNFWGGIWCMVLGTKYLLSKHLDPWDANKIVHVYTWYLTCMILPTAHFEDWFIAFFANRWRYPTSKNQVVHDNLESWFDPTLLEGIHQCCSCCAYFHWPGQIRPNVHKWIWENYNLSLTWIKAIWGWFPLLTMIPVRSQWGRYNLPRMDDSSLPLFCRNTRKSRGVSAI